MEIDSRSLYDMLSDDFWMAIFVHLDAKSLCQIAQTCYTFYLLSDDKVLWLNLLQRDRKKVILVPSDCLHTPKEFYRRKKDFDSLSDAIKAANPEGRDKIFVSPGIYKESIVIDKPVEIYGEGPGPAVIEGSTANTVLSTATEGLLSNLTLRQTGHWFCIDVEKGGVHIKGCDISNSTLSAVKVGREGKPVISGNKIHDTHEAGVAVFGGSGIIEHNEFYRNRYGSIEVVYATATPIIRHNSIYSNKGYGIHIHTLSKPVIQSNRIQDNDSDGISCWGGSDPYVTQNKISRNKGDGIYIHEDGKGTFEQNEISHQKLDGIRTSKSSPLIINNSLHHNEGDGVRIVMSANPTIKGNQIYENSRVGVHVYREGCGTCTQNIIYGNKNAGMQVYGGGNTAITYNKIQFNKCSGVYVSDRACVYLQNNEVSGNGDSGVEIVSGASMPTFEGNDIHHNNSAGVAVYQDSKPPMLEKMNRIHSNGSHHYAQSIQSAMGTQPTCISMMDTSDMELDGADVVNMNVAGGSRSCHSGSSCGGSGGGGGSCKSSSADVVMREGRAAYLRGKENNEIVSFLAEKAIQSKMCTFSLTREYYHAQYWYECRTCSAPRQILGRPEVSVCEQCAKACHVGHELSPRKFGHFYCDCGQISPPFCKCMPNH